jgi:RND family efflux transporter MFP subunit
MKMKNRSGLIIAYLLTATMFFALIIPGCKSKTEESIKRQQISSVKVEPVAVSKIDDIYEVTGTVRSNQTSLVASRVMGVVTSVSVKEGDFVQEGQILITIDDRDATQRLRAAEMSVEAAKQSRDLTDKTWQRYKKLYDEDVVSQQEMDRMDTQKKLADAEYNRVKAMADEAATYLSFTKVTAPVSGRITEKRIDAGSMATPGMPILVIEGGGSSYIEVSMDAGIGNTVKTGMAVEAMIEPENRPVAGIVREIFPAVDPASRTFTAKIGFKDARPRSGLFARVRIPIGKKEVMIVPAQSVVRKGQLTGVYAVDDQGLVTYRLVRTGKSSAAGAEILSGLNANDRIITAGIEKVVDGGVIAGAKGK